MKRAVPGLGLAGLLSLGSAAYAQPEVRESAVEEVMPGVFVRDSAGVTIDLGRRRCEPPCGEGLICEPVCVETACDASDGPAARCNFCAWECVE